MPMGANFFVLYGIKKVNTSSTCSGVSQTDKQWNEMYRSHIKGQKLTELDRKGQKLTEMDRNR